MFNLQGHRGARGLKPENTLPSFEIALDVGVTSIETDLHLTRDGVVVLVHDPQITDLVFRPVGSSPTHTLPCPVHDLTLAELRHWRADCNPDPARFPMQDAVVTPLAASFAETNDIDPFTPPTLEEFFAFVAAYAGDPGQLAGKTDAQRCCARRLCFDLEIKCEPFRSASIDDDSSSWLEERVLAAVGQFDLWDRVCVRNFDHRCMLALKRRAPRLPTAILIGGTALVDPVTAVRAAEASMYCPDYLFLDPRQINQLHQANIAVVPWTVNAEADWQRLLAWGVDGITTDYPDRLARFLSDQLITEAGPMSPKI
jgi:glycerophosphoryl diester phosphodiesterase